MPFTDEQLAAIEHAGGHSLTYAVAGSGKTRMLVGRVCFLLEQGIPAARIRVLAFNKSAAREFAERLAGALPAGFKAPEVSTFHSLGLRLTTLFEKAGLLAGRQLETNDSVEKRLARAAALAALTEEGSDEYPSQDDLEAFRAFIGLVKSDLLPAADAFNRFALPEGYGYFVRAFACFERAREREGLRFFADLQSEPVALMRANPQALAMVTNRLDCVLVDEFQDVSRVQVELLRLLIGTRASLDAVGDDSQCIYAWRGSAPRFMGDDFDRQFPGATRYTLSRTFRFGHRVSLAAALLIANNRNRMDTLCVSAPGTPDTRIEVIRTRGADDQTAVTAAITQWRRDGRRLRDCVVLTRLWAQTLGLELALMEQSIPYHKPKGDLFRVTEVLGLLGWLRLAAGTLGEDARAPETLRAMLTTPTLWLPGETVARLADAMARAPARARDLLYDQAAKTGKAYQAARIRERADLFAEVPGWGDLPAADALRLYAVRTDLAAAFARSASADAAGEKEIAFQSLLGWAVAGADEVRGFLARMDALRLARLGYEAGGDALLLTTIHQAKGLEWPFVILAGLEEGQFPSRRADPEEERRLAYVALTRVKERLLLVVPPDERLADALDGVRDAAAEPTWAGRRARGPAVVRTPASRFVFEAQLGTAAALGGAITARLSGADPDADPDAEPGADPGVDPSGDCGAVLPPAPPGAQALLNRYLGEVGIAPRYASPAGAAPRPGSAEPRRWALNDRVRHRVFGEGRVVGFIDRDILDIDFRGQRRSIKLGVVPLEPVP